MLNSTQLFEILAVLIAILAFEWLVLLFNWSKVKIPREILEEERKRKKRRKYSWTIKIEELEDSLLECLGRLLLDMGFVQYGNKFYSNDSIVIFENESEGLKIIVFSSSPLKIADLAGKIEMEALKCSIRL